MFFVTGFRYIEVLFHLESKGFPIFYYYCRGEEYRSLYRGRSCKYRVSYRNSTGLSYTSLSPDFFNCSYMSNSRPTPRHERRVLMGVPNSQLTTIFSVKYQLTTIFLANPQLTTNFG